MNTKRFDECGTLVEIPRQDGITNKYLVEIPAEPYLLVSMGACYGTAAASFKHPNILAKIDRVFEFKHSRINGSKFWTACAGVEFFFAIPKNQIFLIPEQGYSYVPILVLGYDLMKYVLNVSGGTGGNEFGWKDYIRQGCSMCLAKNKQELDNLAYSAMHPSRAEENGVGTYLERYLTRETNAKYYTQLVASKDVKLKIGSKVWLNDGCSFNGSNGPLVVDYKGGQYMTCIDTDKNRVRVKRKDIDWCKTAVANGIALKEPKVECHIRVPSTVLASIPSSCFDWRISNGRVKRLS